MRKYAEKKYHKIRLKFEKKCNKKMQRQIIRYLIAFRGFRDEKIIPNGVIFVKENGQNFYLSDIFSNFEKNIYNAAGIFFYAYE